jgi:AcrR family transcriptional regulator
MTEERSTAFGLGGATATALPLPPTQARGAEKRDRLYAAALERFDRLGVDATRVEDVVDDAGVSWATFFRYFPRKEDVLIEGAARHYRDRVRPVAEAGIRSRRRVRTVINDVFIALCTAGDLPPLLHASALLQVIANPGRFAALLDDGSAQPLIELLTEVVAEGQRRGEVRDDVPAVAIGMTIAAGAFYPGVQAAAIGGDAAAAMTAALELIWDGAGEQGRERPVP